MARINESMGQQFYDELARRLHQAGYATQFVDGDGFMPVEWQGRPLCRVTPSGGVSYKANDIKDGTFEAARDQVYAIARTVAEYMTLMEQAPPIKAQGLKGDYRALGEFNHVVLAGHPTKFGMEFATWEWVQNHTSLWQGHYYGEDYEKAKADFATRSGLVAEQRQFSAEQLTEIYRVVHETLESGYYIPEEREAILKGVVEQIEQAIPDLEQRVQKSNEVEMSQPPADIPGVTQQMS